VLELGKSAGVDGMGLEHWILVECPRSRLAVGWGVVAGKKKGKVVVRGYAIGTQEKGAWGAGGKRAR